MVRLCRVYGNSVRRGELMNYVRLSSKYILNSTMKTILDVIVDHGNRHPDQLAILASGSSPLYFKDLIVVIARIWEVLGEGGVSLGSRVGIALPSGPESAISIIAIASRATCVPLNPNLSQTELERELARLKLDALIVPAWLKSSAWAAAESCSFGVFSAAKASPALSNFGVQCVRRVNGARAKPVEVSSESAALVLRTSATTGPSKLVPVTHGNMFDLASKMSGWFGLSMDDRAACVLPTYYAAGSKLNVLVPMLLGQSIAIPVAVRSDRVADWISDLRPTWFSAGPSFLQAVLDGLRSRREPMPEHTLRFITSGSAPLPDRLRNELEPMLGCPILQVYGISEAGVMAANPAPPAKRKSATVGSIPPGELVIRGDNGDILPPGGIGEIFVGGPGVMPGYMDDSQLAGAGLKDGWLQTGDLGSVDSDGFLTIVGRTKEVINRGGEKISPYEVESALLMHPSVCEAAAYAVPHPRLGENVAAAVVLQPGGAISSFELRVFLRDRLAPFKIPQRIEFLSSLPRTHGGKISRTQLAESSISRGRRVDPPAALLELQIADIWRRLLNRLDIGIHDDFFELGGDSLLATQMLVEVEAATDQLISQSALFQATTIHQLVELVMRDCGADNALITKAKDGAATPFIFCHGDFVTRGFYALKLVKLIETEHSVHLVHPLSNFNGPSDDSVQDMSMEDMARKYVPTLLATLPSGGFRLGGYCNGGLLAWEIARQLIQAGRTVESIILIDVPSLNSRGPFRLIHRLATVVAGVALWKPQGELRDHWMRVAWEIARQADDERLQIALLNNILFYSRGLYLLVRRIVRSVVNACFVACSQFLKTARKVKQERSQSGAEAFLRGPYFQMMASYMPSKLDCKVTVIVCQQNASKFDFSALPWRRLSRRVNRAVVPGDHHGCITTHIEDVAYVLNEHLTECSKDR